MSVSSQKDKNLGNVRVAEVGSYCAIVTVSHMSDTHRALVWTVQRPGYVLYMTKLLMAGQYNGQLTTARGWHAELFALHDKATILE